MNKTVFASTRNSKLLVFLSPPLDFSQLHFLAQILLDSLLLVQKCKPVPLNSAVVLRLEVVNHIRVQELVRFQVLEKSRNVVKIYWHEVVE